MSFINIGPFDNQVGSVGKRCNTGGFHPLGAGPDRASKSTIALAESNGSDNLAWNLLFHFLTRP
jgi:hypothetical protein